MAFLNFLVDGLVFFLYFFGMRRSSAVAILTTFAPKNEEEMGACNCLNIIILGVLSGLAVYYGVGLSLGDKLLYILSFFIGAVFQQILLQVNKPFIINAERKIGGFAILSTMVSYPLCAFWFAKILEKY